MIKLFKHEYGVVGIVFATLVLTYIPIMINPHIGFFQAILWGFLMLVAVDKIY